MAVSGFVQQGQTVAVAAAATAPTPQQVVPYASLQPIGYLIENSGTVTASLGFGPTAAIATANAVAPVQGAPYNAITVNGGQTITVLMAPNQFVTGVAASATTVFVTPGEGSPQ